MAKRFDTSDVDAVLTRMIENWPTLYRSRLSTLERALTSTYEWRAGKPYDLDSLQTRDDQYDVPLDETLTGPDKDYYPNVSLLRRRRDRAQAEFVRANAALIARAESGPDEAFTSAPDFSTYKLNNLLLAELTPAWRDALVEYCNAVLRYDVAKIPLRNALKGYIASAADREVAQVEQAKKTAQECLIRLGQGSKEAEQVRAQELQKLKYLAESFGLKLVPADA